VCQRAPSSLFHTIEIKNGIAILYFGLFLGYYMYADATFGSQGYVTAVTFPEFNTTGSRNLRFKYHMYGNDTGTLLVKAKLKGDNSVLSLWSLSGNQDNDWDQVCIPLNIAAMTDVELSFIAVRGNGPIGDIGLDDVIVTEEECPRK
jgi:hypothetical protein